MEVLEAVAALVELESRLLGPVGLRVSRVLIGRRRRRRRGVGDGGGGGGLGGAGEHLDDLLERGGVGLDEGGGVGVRGAGLGGRRSQGGGGGSWGGRGEREVLFMVEG